MYMCRAGFNVIAFQDASSLEPCLVLLGMGMDEPLAE